MPPVAPDITGRGVSNPIHTPASSSGVYPTNHTSVLSLVVPVFPAAGMSYDRLPTEGSRAAYPVPRSTTSRIMSVMIHAIPGSMARTGGGAGCHSTSPRWFSTRDTYCGSTFHPPFPNDAYAAIMSRGYTLAAPMYTDG